MSNNNLHPLFEQILAPFMPAYVPEEEKPLLSPKERLIYEWHRLDAERGKAPKERVFPIMRKMERIHKILLERHNFRTPY